MTTQIRLRAVEDADLDLFFEHQQDPDAVFIAAFTSKDPSDREAFDAHWSRIRGAPGIETRTILVEGAVAGHVASWMENGKPEVTYWLGREHWGKGVATEALRLFVDELGRRPVRARVAKDNLASIRVLEKCGFRVFGELRGYAHARGEEVEELLMLLE